MTFKEDLYFINENNLTPTPQTPGNSKKHRNRFEKEGWSKNFEEDFINSTFRRLSNTFKDFVIIAHYTLMLCIDFWK